MHATALAARRSASALDDPVLDARARRAGSRSRSRAATSCRARSRRGRAGRAGRRRRRCPGRAARAAAAPPAGSAGRRACRAASTRSRSRSASSSSPDRPLEQLQRDVAGEAVGDDDVGGAAQQVARSRRCRRSRGRSLAQQRVRLERELVALLRPPRRSRAGAPRARDAEHLLGEDRAHVRELEQVLGARVGVRAGVEQHGRAARARGSARRSPAASRRAGGGGGAGPRRASRRCCRRRRPRRRRPSATARHGRDEARVGLRAHRVGRLVGHLDRLGRASTSGSPCVSSPAGPKSDDLDPVARRRRARRAITSPGALSPPSASTATRATLRSVEAERLDLAALVGAAGRADAMRPLRRAALRARVDARRLDACVRAALVAA